MIDYEKLDVLMELPISEEMLGAYLEGNLHGAELREVQNIVEKDFFVADLISSTEDVMLMNNDLSNSWTDTVADDFSSNADFQLMNSEGFVLPEIVLDVPLGMETYIVQDTTLAQLSGELEDNTIYRSVDEIDLGVSGCENLNNDFLNS